MSKDTLIFIALDTHKEFSEVAYTDDNPGATGYHYPGKTN